MGSIFQFKWASASLCLCLEFASPIVRRRRRRWTAEDKRDDRPGRAGEDEPRCAWWRMRNRLT
jgi:hypothetical protein